MSRRLHRRTRTYALVFASGLGLGLCICLGMWLGDWRARSASSLEFPTQLLHATATHGSDTMAMCTGEIADGMEGVFLIDYLTGELRCWVVHPRTGALGGTFRHNVLQDLGAEAGKATKYLIVTGRASFRNQGGVVQRGDCVVYVANSTTGAFAAYSMPWNRNAASVGAPQAQPLIPIGGGTIRDVAALRE